MDAEIASTSSTVLSPSPNSLLKLVTSTVILDLVGAEIETLLLFECSGRVLKNTPLIPVDGGKNYGYQTGSIKRNCTRTFYNYVSFRLPSTVKGIMNIKVFRTGVLQMTGCKGDSDILHVQNSITELFNLIKKERMEITVKPHQVLNDHFVDDQNLLYHKNKLVGKIVNSTNIIYEGTKVTIQIGEDGVVDLRAQSTYSNYIKKTLQAWPSPPPSSSECQQIIVETDPIILQDRYRNFTWKSSVVSLNATYESKIHVNKLKLVEELKKNHADFLVSYDPSHYSGINVKIFKDDKDCDSPIGTVLIASTGFIVMCGFKSMQSAEFQCNRIVEILRAFA